MKDFSPLSSSAEFSAIYKNATKWHSDACVAYFKSSQDKKFSVVASKKIGKAVARNRAKRLLRAAFCANCDGLVPGRYVLVAKAQILEQNFEQICKQLRWSFRRMECVKTHKTR